MCAAVGSCNRNDSPVINMRNHSPACQSGGQDVQEVSRAPHSVVFALRTLSGVGAPRSTTRRWLGTFSDDKVGARHHMDGEQTFSMSAQCGRRDGIPAGVKPEGRRRGRGMRDSRLYVGPLRPSGSLTERSTLLSWLIGQARIGMCAPPTSNDAPYRRNICWPRSPSAHTSLCSPALR